jgi:hypothetical protein
MVNLTKTEFLAKYGNVYVVFSDYYKYMFHYIGMLEGVDSIISVTVGGNADSIYELGVSADEKIRVSDLDPVSGTVTFSDKESETFYEY